MTCQYPFQIPDETRKGGFANPPRYGDHNRTLRVAVSRREARLNARITQFGYLSRSVNNDLHIQSSINDPMPTQSTSQMVATTVHWNRNILKSYGVVETISGLDILWSLIGASDSSVLVETYTLARGFASSQLQWVHPQNTLTPQVTVKCVNLQGQAHSTVFFSYFGAQPMIVLSLIFFLNLLRYCSFFIILGLNLNCQYVRGRMLPHECRQINQCCSHCGQCQNRAIKLKRKVVTLLWLDVFISFSCY